MKADQIQLFILSHLIRGAWIEIRNGLKTLECLLRRISYEVRGLKFCKAFRLNLSKMVASHTRCVD